MIKYLDMYVGLPSILYDKDIRRRSLYGKAGAFRLTPYGLEYRSLSSAMYANDELISLVWDQVMSAIRAYNEGLPLASQDKVISAINNSNIDLAKRIIQSFYIL